MNESVSDLYVGLAPTLVVLAVRKFGVSREDADCIVQDAFVSLLTRGEEPFDPEAWLRGAVCNLARVYLRKQHAQSFAVGIQAEHVDEQLACAQVLNAIGEKYAEALRLRYFFGYSHEEMATKFGTTPGYTRQLVHRALGRCRDVSVTKMSRS